MKKQNSIISFLLVVIMLVGVLPMNVSAAQEEETSYPVGTVLTYTFNLQVPEVIEDFEGMISYSNDTLKLNNFTLTKTNGVIFNTDYHLSDGTSVIYFCGTSYLTPYDFTTKSVFCTAEFTVISDGDTYAELDWQYLNGLDSQGNNGTHYVTDGVKKNDFDCDQSVEESYNSILKISNVSLTLYSSLEIDYYLDKSLFADDAFSNPYVVFDFCGSSYKVDEYSEYGDYYVFAFEDIAPHRMKDIVTATPFAYYNNKLVQGSALDYSVEKYCYTILNKFTDSSYKKLHTLLVDLLNFGAESQNYKNYKTDDLVNSSLTDEQKALGTQENPTLTTVYNSKYATIDSPSVTYTGVGLILNDSVTITLRASGKVTDDLVLKAVMGNKVWEIPASEFTVSGNSFTVDFDELNSAQMSNKILFTFYKGDTAVSNTMSYSIESYAYECQRYDNENLANITMAMMKYGNSAAAYVG
jgi:CRISPR/Cas system CSM-associated protein Csm3 (group 7 of RAMP superfamily)